MSLCLVTINLYSAVFIQRFQVQFKLPSDRMTVSKSIVSFHLFSLFICSLNQIQIIADTFPDSVMISTPIKTISLSQIYYVFCLKALGRISKEQLYLIFWYELEVFYILGQYISYENDCFYAVKCESLQTI